MYALKERARYTWHFSSLDCLSRPDVFLDTKWGEKEVNDGKTTGEHKYKRRATM